MSGNDGEFDFRAKEEELRLRYEMLNAQQEQVLRAADTVVHRQTDFSVPSPAAGGAAADGDEDSLIGSDDGDEEQGEGKLEAGLARQVQQAAFPSRASPRPPARSSPATKASVKASGLRSSPRPSARSTPGSSARRRATPRSAGGGSSGGGRGGTRSARSPRGSHPARSAGEAEAAAAAAAAELQEELEGVAGMGAAATIRFQKAKLRALEQGVERLQVEKSELSREVKSARGEQKAAAVGRDTARRRMAEAAAETDKQKKAAVAAKDKAAAQEREIINLKREVQGAAKAAKAAEVELRSKDVRLQRALEETDRLKQKLREAKGGSAGGRGRGGGGGGGGNAAEVERLKGENRRLQTQLKELLNAFKKQGKLIDILKRQIMHLEAAKLLSFTEEEFSRSLGMDTKG